MCVDKTRRTWPVPNWLLTAVIAFCALIVAGCSMELPGPDQGAPNPPGSLAADVSFDTGTDTEPDQAPDSGDTNDINNDTDDTDPGDSDEDGEVGPTYTSCAQVKQRDPAAPSGVYTIDFDGTLVDVHCEMTGTGEWMLVGVITNQGADEWSPDAAPNWWEATDLPEQGTLDPDANADYRSPAWHLFGASELRITFNDQFLIRSNGCTGGQSLAAFFSALTWTCGVNVPLTSCSQECPLTSQDDSIPDEEALIGQSERTTLYMKGGKSDDDITGNQERVYISTDRRNVNESQGLGVRCQNLCGGAAGDTDVADAGASFGGVVPAPSDGYYSIWVR